MAEHGAWFGRDGLIDEVLGHLRPDGPRLVTITGPPGVGKSILAARVLGAPGVFAGQVATVGPIDAVEVVVLESVMAQAAGVSCCDPATRRRELGAEPRLLVVDAADRAAPHAVALMAELLEDCRHLRFLVCSRTALSLPGECEVPVGPLGTGDDGADPAVELFVEVARRSGARAAFGSDDLERISDLCRRLGRLPLAIELVAARAGSFTPAALGRLLDAAVRPTRGRTRRDDLCGALPLSAGLLSPGERRLLAELTVFQGAATADAVRAVCGARPDVDADLAALVRARLVDVDRAGAVPTFSLHPLVRERARREVDVDARELISRHTAWAISLARGARVPGPPPGSVAAFEVETAHGDLIDAIHRSVHADAADDATNLARGLVPVWLRHRSVERLPLLTQVVQLADDAAVEPGARAVLHAARAVLLAAECENAVSRDRGTDAVVAELTEARRLADRGSDADRERTRWIASQAIDVVDLDRPAVTTR